MKEGSSNLEQLKEFARTPKSIVLLLISFAFTVVCLSFTAKFICAVEYRPGFAFDDPILSLFEPKDVTWLIFSILYSSVVFCFFYLLRTPKLLTLGFLGYGLLVSLRIAGMYLLPLDPPKTTIPLHDPLIEYFGTTVTLTKDLFFSGHSSLMFYLFFLVPSRHLKIPFLVGALIVSGGVLLQHVHYSVDVFVAPFMAYSSYAIARWFLSKLEPLIYTRK